MRMARVNVYLPDELAAAVKEEGLNVSSITQEALRRALRVRRTNAWLDEIATLPPLGISHDEVIAAIHEAREEFGRHG
jgi:post-segregation antitoxin (ccd killing protein)